MNSHNLLMIVLVDRAMQSMITSKLWFQTEVAVHRSNFYPSPTLPILFTLIAHSMLITWCHLCICGHVTITCKLNSNEYHQNRWRNLPPEGSVRLLQMRLWLVITVTAQNIIGQQVLDLPLIWGPLVFLHVTLKNYMLPCGDCYSVCTMYCMPVMFMTLSYVCTYITIPTVKCRSLPIISCEQL